MSEKLSNSVLSLVNNEGDVLAELLAGKSYQITPIKGQAYKLLAAMGEQSSLADNLIALRSGDDLIIRFADGLEVVMLDYFEICLQPIADTENPEAEAQLDCSITVAADGAEGMQIGSGPASQYELAGDGSPRIVYAHGEDTALASIIEGNAGMEDIYAAYILSGAAPAVAAAAFSPTLLGAVGLGLGAAAGGGGGGGATAAEILMKFTGSVVLGPVVSGHGLTVTAYKADGSELASGTVNSDGTFTINSTVAYTGNVLIVVVDTNTAHDYFDEGTRGGKDLDTDLRAVTTVAGAGDYTVSVNALTELVVKDYTQAHGNTLNGTTAASISTGNRAVADAFGLSSVDLINDEAVAIVDAQGNNNPSANDYGRALAALSGMEHGQSKTTQDVINDVANGLSGSTLTNAVKYELVAGARVAGVDALDMATRLGLANPQQIKTSWEMVFDHANSTSNNATGPTQSQYELIGVTGINDTEQLRLLNQVIDIQANADVDTVAEIQAYLDAVTALMSAAAGNGTEVSLAQLQLLDIGNITSSNLSAVRTAIAATADDGTGVDSLAELRLMSRTPASTISLRDPDGRVTPLTLIEPVITEDGKVYYYVDYDASGDNTGVDYFNHNILDGWFNNNTDTVETQQAGAIAGVDDARTMIIDGYTLVLPTADELRVLYTEAVDVGEMGWDSYHYWTATLGTTNYHHLYAYPGASSGASQYDDTLTAKVALQVLQNTIIDGTAGVDVLTGTNLSEVINGLAANDTIYGNGGSDMIDAGAGDDDIYLNADNLANLDNVIVDGGADIDTLHLVGESLSLDFRSLDNLHVQNIEKIDMTGSGDNVLKIDAADVLDMSSTTDVLKIIADMNDTVHAVDMHDTGMTRVEGDVTYKVYVEPGVNIELWIDEKATVVFTG